MAVAAVKEYDRQDWQRRYGQQHREEPQPQQAPAEPELQPQPPRLVGAAHVLAASAMALVMVLALARALLG